MSFYNDRLVNVIKKIGLEKKQPICALCVLDVKYHFAM